MFVNGLDMAYWRLEKGREDVTYVPQEPFLFAGSVADNLALGLSGEPVKDVDMSTEVRKSLELGDALEFVMSTDEGLDAQVGERGSLLSGGQRQRLCLARGFLRGTPILLLDEPTSSIDREAEARVLSGLSSQRDLTCLMVTHRFDVAEAADLVLVIDRGRLVEAGPHDELLKKQGLYWSMFTGEFPLSSSPSSVVGGAVS